MQGQMMTPHDMINIQEMANEISHRSGSPKKKKKDKKNKKSSSKSKDKS
jgi:hypothetical protein